ncbi:hypothetical protein SUNI508_02230 [Seiridium unicorne]|uniref:Uncharacterized protein n=1 Tax=Seiridium unicorne TaxID=138068 RepID=A0ABR2UID8_9PEZI
MQLRQSCAALLGFSSLVASAPAVERELQQPAERGLRWKSRAQKRSPLAIIQEVQETNIIVVQENLGQLAAQQQIIEQEFAALVQAEVELVVQLEEIKNNIRVNHFKARFSQVNTVIVTVQTLVDQRSAGASNRYLIKQLLADNGKPESEMVVMVSEAATMTIAAASQPIVVNGASAISSPTAAPQISAFDPNAPFGQLNQSLILPAGAQAPKVDQIFADPAAIILPNQNNLFVEDAGAFLSDCAQSSAFFQLQAAQIFGSFEQLAAAQAGAVIINEVTVINDGGNNNNNGNGNKDGNNGDAAAQASAAAAAAASAAAASQAAAPAATAAPEAAPAEAAPAEAAPAEAAPAEAAPAEAAPAEAAPAATTAAAVPAAAPAASAPQGFFTIVPPPAAA